MNTPYLFVWCPDSDICGYFCSVAAEAAYIRCDDPHSQVLLFDIRNGQKLADVIQSCFSLVQRQSIRALLSDTLNPSMDQFADVVSLERMEQELSSRWVLDLLSEQRLRSLMQPIVSATENFMVHGYEFLIRGVGRDGRELPAPTLFKAGGDAGALYLLDLAAGESAIQSAGRQDVTEKLFINVLPSTLSVHDGLQAWIEYALGGKSLHDQNVVFEMVESEHFESHDMLRELGDKIRDYGCEFALDDFGTGFNNLSSLTTVRPDYIKLDKSLVGGITTDAQKWNMVANIIDAAKQSDVRIIAEGIEDEETAQALASIGADFFQGYYFGYPRTIPVRLDKASSL